MPKAHKPDLEAICALPGGSLLALPSGSTVRRQLGAIISLDDGTPIVPARPLDFAPLFERLARETDSLNLEGAAVVGSSLWLAQRGNKASPSALFEIALDGLTGSEVPASAFRRTVPLSLGDVEGIPFTPTDLCPLPDGRLVLSAVCENTSDSYNDGACIAAAIAVLDPGGQVERIEQLSQTFKIEGLVVRSGQVLWMVADADDPARPAPLLEAML